MRLEIPRGLAPAACAVALAIFALPAFGCSSSATAPDDGGLDVVCSVFPEYDWARQVLGDEADSCNLTLLCDSAVDLHNYQPTAADMSAIAGCDVFVYVGGESDSWAADAIAAAGNPDMQVVCLVDAVGDAAVEEEVVEGMQADPGEEEGPQLDEHVWLSLRNAQACVDAVSEALQLADPGNAAVYRANAESYDAQLASLDSEYADAVAGSACKTLLFGDRFPFRYLAEDYGLDYYAAFSGCSAESEASFETVRFLAGKVDELGLRHVMTIEGSDGQIAETVVANTASGDQDVLSMNSMQGVSAEDVAAGATYLGIMRDNLAVLAAALS